MAHLGIYSHWGKEGPWMRLSDRLDSDAGEIQISVLGATIISSGSSDVAKLNQICHMNYSNYL